jgi:hypothetical protein
LYKEYPKLPDNIREHQVKENWGYGFHSKKELLARALNHPNNQKHIAYFIGEIEGVKWLTAQGYEVYQFGLIGHYFELLNNTVERLKKRHKKEFVEKDGAYIKTLEQLLREFSGEHFDALRQVYTEALPVRSEIRETVQFADQVGGVSPDFIVKKNNEFSFVEIKANTSQLPKGQRICFEIAKKHGFKAMVLRVIVESNPVKEISFTEHK